MSNIFQVYDQLRDAQKFVNDQQVIGDYIMSMMMQVRQTHFDQIVSKQPRPEDRMFRPFETEYMPKIDHALQYFSKKLPELNMMELRYKRGYNAPRSNPTMFATVFDTLFATLLHYRINSALMTGMMYDGTAMNSYDIGNIIHLKSLEFRHPDLKGLPILMPNDFLHRLRATYCMWGRRNDGGLNDHFRFKNRFRPELSEFFRRHFVVLPRGTKLFQFRYSVVAPAWVSMSRLYTLTEDIYVPLHTAPVFVDSEMRPSFQFTVDVESDKKTGTIAITNSFSSSTLEVVERAYTAGALYPGYFRDEGIGYWNGQPRSRYTCQELISLND